MTVVLVARIPQAAARARLMDKVKDAGLAGMAATEVVVAEVPPMGQDRDVAGVRVEGKVVTVVLPVSQDRAAGVARAEVPDKVERVFAAGPPAPAPVAPVQCLHPPDLSKLRRGCSYC